MSALDELQNLKIGPDFLTLLGKTFAATTRQGSYPAPSGREHWDADDIRTAVANFLASNQTPRRLTDLRTHCRDERSLAARLQRTVKNFLADGGRRTPIGRLVRRFNEVLATDPRFERDGIYWRLTGADAAPQIVDFDRLVKVVAAIEVEVPAAWRRGNRNSPEIDKASVLRVAHAAIDAAGGPLRPGDLAKLAAERLGLGRPPLSLEAFAFEPAPISGRPTHSDGADGLLAVCANDVFTRLNEKERLSIGLSELSTVALGEVLGLSGSKAHLIRRRAVTIMQDELGDDEHGQAIAEIVLEVARIWSKTWTTEHGPT